MLSRDSEQQSEALIQLLCQEKAKENRANSRSDLNQQTSLEDGSISMEQMRSGEHAVVFRDLALSKISPFEMKPFI